METKKKRKRSAKNNEDEEVSTKMAKTAHDDVDKKLGLADEDGDNVDDQESAEKMDEETPLPVDNRPFVVKKFQSALRKSSCITDIRIFIQKATADPTIVSQFLREGGKPLEIALTLNKIDKTELFHVSYIFNALHLILMEKMNQPNELNTDAVETCAFILNNHRASIEKLLGSNYATHKRAVLKLLTDTVYLAPHLGRELLATFNIAFNSETLARFTAHEKNQCHLPTEERVRTCYVYFILAFIIEGNYVLIRNLLDRTELTLRLLSGLVYDSKEVVLLVLNSLLKFVLQSGEVMKTKKVQVFDSNVLKELVRLFEWKGPEYFAAICSKKTKDKASQFINIQDYDIVCDVTHQFLCELLASRKHGVAFMCLGQRNTKSNRLQKKFISSIDHFMGNPHKSRLIIEILKTCPELMKNFVRKYAPCLDPSKKNNNWVDAVKFFTDLIDEMSPKIIRRQIDNVNAKELIELIKEICMAPELLQQLRNKDTLRSANLTIRLKATNLLHAMLKQYNQYLYSLTNWCPNRTNDIKKIKFEMINHITAHCPSVEHILLSLHMSQVDESTDSNSMFEHLECILDLLLIITESVPAFIETTSSVINYIKILGPIYELNRELDSSTRIEFKAVKLMLALEPKALSPNTQLFNDVIQSFFNVYRFGAPNEQIQAKHLLRTVFQNTGLFQNGSLEIDLWLTAMNQMDEDSVPSVRQFLVDRIKCHDASESKDLQLLQAMPGETSDNNLIETFKRIERRETLKGILDVVTLNPIFLSVVKHSTEMEDERDEKEGILTYVETLAFYLFHYLPQPESVFHIMESIPNKYSSYMKKWITQSKCGMLPDETADVLKKLYSALIDDATQNLLQVFAEHIKQIDPDVPDCKGTTETIAQVNFNGIDYVLSATLSDETQIMIFIYMLMFVTNKMHKNCTLSTEKCNQIVRYFADFMTILNAIATKTGEINQFGFEVNESHANPSIKALQYTFSNCYYLLHSFDIWSKENQITRLVYEMVKSVEQSDHLNEILVHYRQKISKQIANAIDEDDSSVEACEYLLDLITTFRLDFDNCSEILIGLSKLSYTNFITEENDLSIHAGILANTLHRLAELKQQPLDTPAVSNISAIYVDLVRKTDVEINYQIIEEALYSYLAVYYHHIANVADDLLDSVFEAKRLNKSAIKLACLLIDRDSNHLDRLPKLIEDNMTKKELVYPLLNVIAVKNINLDDKLLSKLFADYKNGILKTIERPQKAAVIYKENVLSSVCLIEKCMPIKDCTDFIKKSFNFDGGEVFQLQIIKSIHLKVLMHSDNVEAIQQSYECFLHAFIRVFATVLKSETLDSKKVNAFARIVFDWTKLKLKLLPAALSSRLGYADICGSEVWLQFGKSCLKHALRLTKIENSKKIQQSEAAVLLKLLAYLCNEFYKNDGQSEDAKIFFEMTTSHPNFFDIITMQQQNSTQKTNLAYLLYVLVRKNSETMASTHIPILLGGYQAKMSHCDQYLLALLQLYEQNGCNTHKYRPFLFGESALSHYSLTTSATIQPNLLQEPPMMQVMALIDPDISENTLVNFPAWRTLNVIDQVPSIEFECHGIAGEEHSNAVSMAQNNIEKLVESGETKFNANILGDSARRDQTFENVYDPAFLIPVMQMAFAPESFTKPLCPAQNGLVAVTFACLSSCDKDMRLAAAAALQRYRNHMESARFVDNKLWLHFFDGVTNGIQHLTLEARKRKKNRIPRIPYVAGVFFARTINILMNPLSELYRPLSTFLLIKNAFDFTSVPDFNVLFHGADVNHSIHRAFILDVLRDGLKTGSDFHVLIANHIFKALFGYFGSTVTQRERNIQILTVANAAVKIPRVAKLMIDVVGIIPWLSKVIDNVEFFQFDFLDILCTLINNLHNSIIINRNEFGQNAVNSIEIQLLPLLFKISPNLSSRIAETSFVRYLNVLKNVSVKGQRTKYLNEDNVKHLIKCASGFVNPALTWDCEFLMENPTAHSYCERKFEYNRKLREAGIVDEQTIFILSSLREIIISWQQNKRSLIRSE